MQGEEACVEVVASNFNNILAMQFSIEYDETIKLNDIQNINLRIYSSNIGNPSPGVITLSWTSNSDLVNGATIPDGTTIFEICFDAIGSEGVYPIDFSNTPTAIEIIDALTTSAIDPVNLVSGSVEIEEDNGGGGSDDFTLDISEVSVMQGEEACVEVVAEFRKYSSDEFSIEYDETALSFDNIQNINLVDLIPPSFGNQVLVLLPFGRVT